jgi:hypothetical protein
VPCRLPLTSDLSEPYGVGYSSFVIAISLREDMSCIDTVRGGLAVVSSLCSNATTQIGAEIKLVVHVHRSDGETIWTDGLDIVAGILEHHVLVN